MNNNNNKRLINIYLVQIIIFYYEFVLFELNKFIYLIKYEGYLNLQNIFTINKYRLLLIQADSILV